MRKITLFLAMMVAMITTAMAQEPLTATASPQGTVSKIWGDGDVTITFNKPVEYTEPEGGLKIVNANNEVVSNVSAMNFNTDKTNAFVMLDNSIDQGGTYTLTIPAGTFTTAEGESLAETTFTFIIEAEEVVVEPEWWTDFDYASAVKEFSKITINFDNVTEVKLNEGVASYLYTSSGAEYEGTAEIKTTVDEKDGKTSTKIEISFGETFTKEATYYVNIPAGLFTMNGSVNNEEKNLQFRINAPVDVTPLEILSITPKINKDGQLEEIEIVYNQQVYFGNQDNYWSAYVVYLTDSNGNKHSMWQKDPYDPITWIQVIPANTVVLIPVKLNDSGYPYEQNEYGQLMASPITLEGEYTLNLAEVTVRYGYDKALWEYNAGGAVTGTYTFDKTTTAIDAVEAETENAVIFDLTGRRVKEISNAGIYIVNGVKKVVK